MSFFYMRIAKLIALNIAEREMQFDETSPNEQFSFLFSSLTISPSRHRDEELILPALDSNR